MQWADDADGDVFRSLEEHGFDFCSEHVIDFNIDFPNWPPSEEAIDLLKERYIQIVINPPSWIRYFLKNHGENGFVQVTIESKLTYELVMDTQEDLTQLVSKYRGYCNSWGVMN